MNSSRTIAVLVVVLVLGGVLRLFYLQEVKQAPDFASPAVDAGFHDYWARGLALGEWTPEGDLADPLVRETPYFRPPGYPYFLALIYGAFGSGPTAPRLVQMGLGLVNVLLAFLLGARWFGRTVGLVVAALMSGYWALLYFEAELHAPALFVFLLLSFANLLGLWRDHGSAAVATGAGFCCGLAALVRPNALVVLAASTVWMIWILWGQERSRGSWLAVVGLAIGGCLAVAPATIRNYVVAGDLVLISSNAGINFYIGNNERADGLVATEIPGLGSFTTCFDWPGIAASLEQQLGKEMKHSEVSSYFAREGLRFVRENPVRAFRLTLRKLLLFWGPREVAHNKELHFDRRFSGVLRKLPGNFAAVFALAIVGGTLLLLDRRRDRLALRGSFEMAVLIGLIVSAYFLSVVPFFAAARYRVPIVPFLLLFVAYALRRGTRLVLNRNFRAAIAFAVAFLALYGITTRPFADYEPSLGRWHFDRGTDYGRTGHADEALREYERAVESDPHLFQAHYNLAHELRGRGRIDEAIEHWNETVRLYPAFASAHYNLAESYREQRDLDRALSHIALALRARPNTVKYLAFSADLLLSSGRLDPARTQYEKVLALRPDHLPAMRNLAWILATHPNTEARDPVLAIHLAERASAQAGGRSSSVLDVLAAGYAAAGRFDEAVTAARRALDVARASGQDELAQRILERLESYEKRATDGTTR